ncbi:MAG: EamA family transporter [Bdellovibrionales bacterium]|nr:EamA family transporter [Bdellovibrionales bacterium]
MWLVFAILTALFESLKDVLIKRRIHNINPYLVAWGMVIISCPFLVLALLFVPTPELGKNFWWALLASGVLDGAGVFLYIKALSMGELSLIVPLVAFTPLFLLATSPIMLGEFPNEIGLLGVVLIVVGSYVLNLSARGGGFFAPFKALVKHPGSRLMLLVAFIWSVTSNVHRIGINNSSVIFWGAADSIAVSILMIPVVRLHAKQDFRALRTSFKALAPVGVCNAAMFLCMLTAINMSLVAYVISVKRLSTVLSVLMGHMLFKEEGLRERLLGALIMVAGVFCIALS